MAVNWSSNVNTKFYNLETESVENIETLEFESGKVRTFMKNSSSKKAHSISFDLNNKQEEIAFWDWYDNTLLSRTQSFYLQNLITGNGVKAYLMTEEPQIPDGQYPKACNITVREE